MTLKRLSTFFRPAIAIELLVWFFMHTLYKMTVVGSRNIPAKKGALLVSNSISYVDHGLIFSAIKRPVRFFMGRQFYDHPFLNPLARAIKAIPVHNSDGPKSLAKALYEARKAISAGEIVCIFAEGDVTRLGNMLPFGRGMEFIMRGLDAPIIPMHLDRIWGSTFSFVDGKLHWRLPKILPYPVTITFGRPMPSNSKASDVRLSIQELSVEAFKLRGKNQKPLHLTFLDEAKKRPFRFCMADSLGNSLNRIKLLTGMLVLSAKLFPKRKNEIPSEKIGLLLPTSTIGVAANGAALFAGKIPVNLNYTSAIEIIDSCAAQCEMKTIITSREFINRLNIPPDDRMIYLEDVKASIGRVRPVAFFLASLLLPADTIKFLFSRGEQNKIDDLATIIFSSGSTGEPKGVMLTHQNILSNIESAFQLLNIKDSDVLMGVLPFFHSFGYMATLWLPLVSGVGIAYHTNPLDAQTVGDMVKRHNASILIGTPVFVQNYQRKCSVGQFASLRLVITGAEKMRQSIAEAFFNKFGVPPLEGYGCTELSPVVSLGIPSYIHPTGKFVQVGNKPGTVGHPIPGVAAKVVDTETFEDLPVGREGMLLIKGPNVMKGYYNDIYKTKEVMYNGWYITGDVASIDDDGFISITDRISRFSKIAGEMVPHLKIEDEIHDVLNAPTKICVVTGLPDEIKGERLVVLYSGELDIDFLWKELNKRGLPKLWIPKRECFFKVEEVPSLGAGKLDLKKIREVAQSCANSALVS
jgi:acyl-[acyl-carrier-protein]-phospholipid O-acyltransferase / long-chain-fatty-acid--[acyl-carrier-protein] ligase